MKKSTILLAVALVFFLGCLMAFNFKLKSIYEAGEYKDRYRDYKTLEFTDFDAIEVNGGNIVSVRLTQGPHQVRVHEKAHEYLKVSQKGKKLLVDMEVQDESLRYQGEVLISIPTLTKLEASSKPKTYNSSKNGRITEYVYSYVHIIGFTQDSLLILQDNASQVDLRNNSLGNLTAVVGTTPDASGTLTLTADNKIQVANFDIRNKSTLNLENVFIPSIQYQFSDSASANISGASLKLLGKK